MLRALASDAIIENRFADATVYQWTLAADNLAMVSNAKQPASLEDIDHLENFTKLNDLC